MSWLEWLENSGPATAVREGEWIYPAVETLHILGIAVLVGSAAMWDLRLLGFSRRLAVSDLADHLLPAARAGFAVAVGSGLLLFASDAVATAGNPAFRIKLVLIAAAVTNAYLFHARTFRYVMLWDRDRRPPQSARINAMFSLVLWGLVVVAGRLIAYV